MKTRRLGIISIFLVFIMTFTMLPQMSAGETHAQTEAVFTPMTISSGLNADCVWETNGNKEPLDNVDCFYADSNKDGSFPMDRTIAISGGGQFDLSAYDQYNTLKVSNTSDSHTLSFDDTGKGKYSKLAILATGTNSGGSLKVTVKFTNRTETVVQTLAIPDWYVTNSNASNIAYRCGRVQAQKGVYSTGADYGLFSYFIDIPEGYQGWEIAAIDFKATSLYVPGSTTFGIFAVSGLRVPEDAPVVQEHTITFDGNGGTPEETSITAEEDTDITLPNAEYDEDHEFAGWYDGDTKVGDAGDSYTVTKEATLTAKWTDIPLGTFTVSFDADGGTPAPESVTEQKNKYITLPSVEKENHRFDGWYDGDDCVGSSGYSYQIKKDVALKAKWTNISNKRKVDLVFGEKHKAFAKTFADYLSSERNITATAQNDIVSMVITAQWDEFVSIKDFCEEYREAIYDCFKNNGKSAFVDKGEHCFDLASKPGSELNWWDYYELLEKDDNNNLTDGQTLFVLWSEPVTELSMEIDSIKCGRIINDGGEYYDVYDALSDGNFYYEDFVWVSSDDISDKFSGTVTGGQSCRAAVTIAPEWLKYYDPANPPKIQIEGGLATAVTVFKGDYENGTIFVSVPVEHDWGDWNKPNSEKEVWERSCSSCSKTETKKGKCKLTIHSSCVDGEDKHKSKKPLAFEVEPGTPIHDLENEAVSAFEMEGFVPSTFYKKPLSGYTDIEKYKYSSFQWNEKVDKDMEVYYHLKKLITHAEATVESPECGVTTDTPISGYITYSFGSDSYTVTEWGWARQTNPPVVRVPEDKPYSFVRRDYGDDYDGSWWRNGDEPFFGTFTAGETYDAEFSIVADIGYLFDEGLQIKLHNAEYVSKRTLWSSPCFAIKVKAVHAGEWKKIDDEQHKRTCPHDSTVETQDHEWDAGKVTKEATTSATGIRTISCTKCEAKKTEVIPKKQGGSKDPGGGTNPGRKNPGSDPNLKGSDGTALGTGASAAAADKAITAMKSDADPAGSKFSQLQLKSTKQTKKSVRIAWKKAGGAKKYVVYGNACGAKNKMMKLATVTGTSMNFTKIAGKKIRKGTYYKFLLVALDKSHKVVSSSKLIHVATVGGKVGNHKSVTVKAKVGKKTKVVSKVTVKKGKALKLKTALNQKNKKLKVKKHVAARYESTNTKIATVSGSGTIKAKTKGRCFVYVYAQNGVFKKLKVTIK